MIKQAEISRNQVSHQTKAADVQDLSPTCPSSWEAADYYILSKAWWNNLGQFKESAKSREKGLGKANPNPNPLQMFLKAMWLEKSHMTHGINHFVMLCALNVIIQ